MADLTKTFEKWAIDGDEPLPWSMQNDDGSYRLDVEALISSIDSDNHQAISIALESAYNRCPQYFDHILDVIEARLQQFKDPEDLAIAHDLIRRLEDLRDAPARDGASLG